MAKDNIAQQLRKNDVKKPLSNQKCDEDKCPIVKKGKINI